jgi:type II secretory pathway component PulF
MKSIIKILNDIKIPNFGWKKDRDMFVENMSTLVVSGMGVLDAMLAIKADVKSTHMISLIDKMSEDIESGVPLWKSMNNAKLFPEHTISLIRVGEESGKLSENLRVVSLQQAKDKEFQSKIRSALMYPVFVLGLTAVIGIGIAWFILPKLATVFGQLKIKLPLVTQVLIGTGSFLGKYGAWAVPLFLLVCGVIAYFLFSYSKTKKIGQALLFMIPGVSNLIMEVELARFGYLLGTLLQAGLPITQAIQSLEQATIFPHYKAFYKHLGVHIEDGNSFQESFASFPKLNRLIPTPMQQLIVTGEKSGNLPETLVKISALYEGKTDTSTKNLSVILEPILLVIVWLGVVAVAMAVILPIYSLVGGLQT